MSTAPRRSLAGAFAPAARSAGLLEALPPARNLRSVDPEPAGGDPQSDAAIDTTQAVPGERPAPPDAAPDEARATPATAPTRAPRAPRPRHAPAGAPPPGGPETAAAPDRVEDDTATGAAPPPEAQAGVPAEVVGEGPDPAADGTDDADDADGSTGTTAQVDPRTPPAGPDPDSADVPSAHDAATTSGTERAGATPRPDPGSADDVVRSVAVYLPPGLLARLKQTAHDQQATYAEVLVQAAHTHVEHLAGRFFRARPTPTAGGMPTRARSTRRVGGVQTQLRLDGHQIAWLDTTVRRTGAPSRSALVVALLDAALQAPTART